MKGSVAKSGAADAAQGKAAAVADPPAAPAKSGRRLSLNLAGPVYDELALLADERGTTMTEIIRLALGVIRVVIRETKQKHKLIIADQDGKALKELVLPE
jgi:hypothetical protein